MTAIDQPALSTEQLSAVAAHDTPEPTLDNKGVVARARRVQGTPVEGLVELRPTTPGLRTGEVVRMSDSTRTAIDSAELRGIQTLEAQLIARFSPPLEPEDVRRCLSECVASYESARVRSYLPVLVEREATRRLRDLSASRLP